MFWLQLIGWIALAAAAVVWLWVAFLYISDRWWLGERNPLVYIYFATWPVMLLLGVICEIACWSWGWLATIWRAAR